MKKEKGEGRAWGKQVICIVHSWKGGGGEDFHHLNIWKGGGTSGPLLGEGRGKERGQEER